MATTPASERLALIRENLAEILNPEIIEKIIDEGRNPKVYWGEWESIPSDVLETEGTNAVPPQEPRQRAALTAATLFPPSRLPSC